MHKIYAVLICSFWFSLATVAQTTSIHGKVIDDFGESIPFSTIYISKLEKGATADLSGNFVIEEVPLGRWKVSVKAVGYQEKTEMVRVEEDMDPVLIFQLSMEDLLGGVEVFGNKTVKPDKIEALTRLPLNVYDQIQSISIISDKLIREQGALTIAEVAHNVPGVYTFATYGNKRESMSSRGFRGIPILKNGVRVHSDFRGVGILTDMQGVDNMQVLKGSSAIAQGVATDLGSPGGVINLVTKTPKFYNGGSVGLRVGSFGQVRATYDVFAPVNESKTLAFRINGALETANSYRDMVKSDRIYINPSVKWLINKNTTLIAEMDYFNDGRTPDLGTVNLAVDSVNAIYNLPYDQFVGFKNDRSNTMNSTYAVRLEHRLSSKLQLNFAFYQSNLELKDKGASLGKSIVENGESVFNKRSRGYSVSNREDKNSVLQLDFVGSEVKTGFATHTFQVGLDFRSNKFNTFSQKVSVADTIDVFGSISNSLPEITLKLGTTAGAESRSIGFVAQDVISFTSWFKTFLGVRVSKTEVIQEQENALSTAVNPLGGIVLSPFKNVNAFASYTNSSYPRSASRLSVDGEALGNERFDQLEAGIKSYWFHGRFRINLTFFKINNIDINLPVYDENWVETGYYQKGGNDQRQGVELEFTGRVLKNLELIAGYSYIDAQYKDHTSYVRGSAPLNTPKHTYNAFLNYQFVNPVFEGLSIGAGAYYIGKRPINDWSAGPVTHEGIVPNQKPFDVNSYTEVNAQIAYSFNKHWNTRLIANNIFNEIGYNAYRTSFINQTTPRNFAFVVEYNF